MHPVILLAGGDQLGDLCNMGHNDREKTSMGTPEEERMPASILQIRDDMFGFDIKALSKKIEKCDNDANAAFCKSLDETDRFKLIELFKYQVPSFVPFYAMYYIGSVMPLIGF